MCAFFVLPRCKSLTSSPSKEVRRTPKRGSSLSCQVRIYRFCVLVSPNNLCGSFICSSAPPRPNYLAGCHVCGRLAEADLSNLIKSLWSRAEESSEESPLFDRLLRSIAVFIAQLGHRGPDRVCSLTPNRHSDEGMSLKRGVKRSKEPFLIRF